jgi:hypothetical protein
MATIHDQVDELLAADVHNQLSEEERRALHTHLVECATCRRAHQENKIMNKVLEETLATEKPDPAFEQRMLAGFRQRSPQRSGGFAKFIVDLMRLRSAQIAAAAALFLALVQTGRLITGEGTMRSETASTAESENVAMLDAKTQREPPVPAQDRLQAGAAGAIGQSKIAAAEKSAPYPVDTYRRDDITRLGVRSSESLSAQPAAKAAAGESSTDQESTKDERTERSDEAPNEGAAPLPGSTANRKLIRNAQVELEILSFDDAVQKITAFAGEERGYVATSNSEKQANGKLKGEVVVKVIPENLDRFLQKIRGLGELKNQTLGTEDVTKAYFDTDSRLKNARVMEQRLIEILKKKSQDVNDLLQVEKELGRVREQIEQMQGELKFMDSQVQFATVTISLAEKDMNVPAAFLLKERAQLALYTPDVEKVYNDIKAIASPKVQITHAQLDRDNTGRVSARVSMLIAPEESDAVLARVKGMGRVENFQVQTERVAQGGTGMSENAKTERDKVELNVGISRDEQEQALQQTTLRIRTSTVDEKTKDLRSLAEKQDGRVRSSSFNRDPDGREFANVSLRVPMKNYRALIESLGSLGKVENVSVQRQDSTGRQTDEANAPADLSIQVYSQGNIVSHETGLFATLRRTLAQGAGALMWSFRMIGVAIAFFAPWAIALTVVIWITRRVVRARRRRN